MKNKAIWKNRIKEQRIIQDFEQLETDILIIGGGIAGLSVAYFLQNTKQNIILIDKGDIAAGVTSKTTAKITYLQETIYQDLEKSFGIEVAKKYFDSQKESISLIKDIISRNNIDCDFCQTSSIIFTVMNSGINKIKKEKKILEDWNVSVLDVQHNKIKTGFKVEDTYTFDPLKYLSAMYDCFKDKIGVYCNTIAKNIRFENQKYYIETNKGVIISNKVVVCCHYPFFLYPTFVPLKTYIKREYVNASKVIEHENYMAINVDQVLHSIRFYHDYLIYGSNKQRLTSKINYEKSYEQSKKDFRKYFGLKPEYTWMNQDVMSNDQLPFIGEVKDNLYLATAFNAWGMTNGTIAGKVIADLVVNKNSVYKDLFDPKRMSLPLILESVVGSFRYLKVYAQSLWKKNNPTYIKIEGILYGVYIDNEDKRHIVRLLCPHMKCNLVFNREEKTWDCPCHGSRFDLDGHVIEGPATYDITKCNH